MTRTCNLGKKYQWAQKSLGLLFGLVALIPATRLSLVTFYDNFTTLRKYIGNVW